jgi:hypothetical protein
MLAHMLASLVVLVALAADAGVEAVPPDWYPDGAPIGSPASAQALFDASQPGPPGTPVGLACEVRAPDGFAWSSVELSTQGFAHPMPSYAHFVFVPFVVTGPTQFKIFQSNLPPGQAAASETMFAMVTAGASLLRLIPSLATTLTLPAGAAKASLKGFSAECRVIGQQSVDAAVSTLRKSRPACTDLSCLGEEVSLLGPADASVRAQAARLATATALKEQRRIDAQRLQAHQWLAVATTNLSGLTLEAVTRCGPTCARMTLVSTAPVLVDLPEYESGFDAAGRAVKWSLDAKVTQRRLQPGQRVTVDANLRLDEGHPPIVFPVVVQVPARWYARTPGEVKGKTDLYRFGAPSPCTGDQGTLSVQWTSSTWQNEPLEYIFADGSTRMFMMPMEFKLVDGLRQGTANFTWPKGCPALVGVRGDAGDPVFFALP